MKYLLSIQNKRDGSNYINPLLEPQQDKKLGWDTSELGLGWEWDRIDI